MGISRTNAQGTYLCGETIYIMPGFQPYGELMEKLGPHKTGKSCLYLNNLDAIDRDVLEQLIRRSVGDMRQKHSCD